MRVDRISDRHCSYEGLGSKYEPAHILFTPYKVDFENIIFRAFI